MPKFVWSGSPTSSDRSASHCLMSWNYFKTFFMTCMSNITSKGKFSTMQYPVLRICLYIYCTKPL